MGRRLGLESWPVLLIGYEPSWFVAEFATQTAYNIFPFGWMARREIFELFGQDAPPGVGVTLMGAGFMIPVVWSIL
jgi:hypothetical protein